MQSYRDLIAWQKAVDLVIAVYNLTNRFPKSEAYGLTSQMQRAAVSIPSNIAEGDSLKQTQAYSRHLASGSLAELEKPDRNLESARISETGGSNIN
jgi:four helix bundle protein